MLVDGVADLSHLTLQADSGVPLYRQLADSLSRLIAEGTIQSGDRLPPTRELANQLGLNRNTVTAAYSALGEAGLIRGHVGRGSFVAGAPGRAEPSYEDPVLVAAPDAVSFSNSRPGSNAFPLESFRRIAKEVIDSFEAPDILQLGPTHGYAPLRRCLLHDALANGLATSSDDLLITNGCQQALDLFARVFLPNKTPVAVEDPVYHGLIRVLHRAGAELIPVPVDGGGIDVDALETAFERHRVKVLMATPSFQNPTGATLSMERRQCIVQLARRHGVLLIENDIYSELRYRGEALPRLKELDECGNTILLRSYSKILFPGLRVGWVIGPRAVIAKLADAKQMSDLHSDQLSQAILARFSESGELESHLKNVRVAGRGKLEAAIEGCKRFLPQDATFTRPDGGMNLWIELPAPLTAERLLERAQERGVNFLPGRYFSARSGHIRGLRISFGGLAPEEITRGLEILGECAARELAATRAPAAYEPSAVLV
jgi:2-aminoadipate transaminase